MSAVEPLLDAMSSVPGADDRRAPYKRGPFRPPTLTSTRRRIGGSNVARAFSVLDQCVVVTTLIAAGAMTDGLLAAPFAAVLPVLVGSGVALATIRGVGGYAFTARETSSAHLAKIAVAAIGGAAAAWLLAVAFGAPRLLLSAWTGLLPLMLLAAHGLWLLGVHAWRVQGRMTPNIVVVGATENARKLIDAALSARDVAVLGVFDDRLSRSPDAVSGVPVLGDTKALLSHPLLPYVDRIVITVTPSAQGRVRDLIDQLRVLPNAVTLFMDTEGAEARRALLSRLSDSSWATASGSEGHEQRALAKRVQDLVIASMALLAAAPVMAAVALAVRLDSPGPVFFRQRRHGFNNEAITVWKFRSMRTEATDATAARQVSKDDDRVTGVGRVIRKLSLDELPQLFNVVSGEMSLVGPRPHPIGMKTAGEDAASLVWTYAWRHRLKPGLTGWAQINGSIGAIDTPELVRRRVALDVEYIERQSFWFDLYILAMTIPALITTRDAVR